MNAFLNGVSIKSALIHCYMCVKDLEMFDEVTDTPTVARTSNLNEELGQVCLLQCVVDLLFFPFIYNIR